MPLVNDYLYHYEGEWDARSSCRLRIYARDDQPPVVIATELFASADTSVTSVIELLAAEVVTGFLRRRVRPGGPFVLIRHWPAVPGTGQTEDFAMVTFDDYQPTAIVATPGRRMPYGSGRLRLGTPEWHDITRDEVETLIGERLREGR
jgi:hypothetical protein